MAIGEAVIFFDLELAGEFDYRCKQAGQLCSKMRYLSAPWVGMLESGALLKNGKRADGCAKDLEKKLQGMSGINILYPVEANSVFVQLPTNTIDRLHEQGWHFYNFIGNGGCRFMCSWDTTEEDVEKLSAAILKTLSHNE